MNETAPAPKKSGRWKWLTAPARWSLPARVAALTACGLALMVLTAWLIFLVDPNSVPWRHAMTWWRVLIAVALVVVIPIVVYRGLRLWLEGERSRFPDIDYAWKAGLEALADHGIALDSAPLFVVLGSAGPRKSGRCSSRRGAVSACCRRRRVPLRCTGTPIPTRSTSSAPKSVG